VAPVYYNLSANYQYQLALNYRLQEKSILSFEFIVETNDDIIEYDLGQNSPSMYPDGTPIILAYFYNSSSERVYIDENHLGYDIQTDKLSVNIAPYWDQGLVQGTELFVSLYAELQNKYQYYHDFIVNLADDDILLLNWTTTQSPEDFLMVNYESSHFIYDIDPYKAVSKGRVKQIFAILNNTNSLIYYLTEDLNDANAGWESYNTLIMKMGFLNPDILSYLNVSFFYTDLSGVDQLIGTTKVTLDMFEDDSGTIYIKLPDSGDFNKFTVKNNAYIIFTPIFKEPSEFNGDFFGKGLPTTQIIEWSSEDDTDGYLNVDLLRRIFSDTQKIYVFNEMMELIYEITEIDTRTEKFSIYDNKNHYTVEYNNISLPSSYIDSLGNQIFMEDGDILFIKYNASLEASIGLAIDEMVLQKGSYISNYLTGVPDVPFAEISLLGINNDGNNYTINDLYDNRDKLVAWEIPLDLTPFESEFYNTYQQRVFNISFDDIYSGFKVLDENEKENCYLTDILITSNDPRYQIVVDSIFIFEFIPNGTLYDSTFVDIYPNNHLEKIYFGNYTDIYSQHIIVNTSEFSPLYSEDDSINEAYYFDAFDEEGNRYYFDSQLISTCISPGVYDIEWNPYYSEEYYYAYINNDENVDELREYYQPHIDKYSYLYISWANNEAWKEWHTIEAPNINSSSLEVSFEWFDDVLNEYESVSYSGSLNEFKTRNIAVETLYPYNSDSKTDTFMLSQDYSNAQNLDIIAIKGFFYNESFIEFGLSNIAIDPSRTQVEINAPDNLKLIDFEKIIIYFSFSEGAYSDFTQYRLLDGAITNHPAVPLWTKNDTFFVSYEYHDIDYFLVMEDYFVGSNDSLFEYLPYARNERFINYEYQNVQEFLDKKYQYHDFENFSEVNDPKSILEFHDLNLDGSHELIVQKDDLTGNGIYDSFKYGFLNPAGEITFHTLIQKASYTESHADKKNDISVSEEYQVDWEDIFRDYYAIVQRTIETNTTIFNRIDTMAVLIQKDLDFDSEIDKEVVFESRFYTTQVISCTKEITHIHFKPTVNNPSGKEQDGYLTEYRNSTYSVFDSSFSFAFKDFEDNQVSSIRYYDDIFPNEITEKYDPDNYLTIAINDLNDYDSRNDIDIEVPALEQLIGLTHPYDGVPAIFDRRIIIENQDFEVENLLATKKVLSVPGSYNLESGISDYMTEQKILIDVIEIIPQDGVYYDNFEGYSPERLKEYSYWYFDENNDGIYSTIFIVDSKGEVQGVGFDYDSDSHFQPNKLQPVEKHIIYNEPSGWQKTYYDSKNNEFRMDYLVLDYINFDLIHYEESDKYEGWFAEPTFRDSLFDIWKTNYVGGSSKLMQEVKAITSDMFIQSLSPLKIAEDILWQVEAQTMAWIAGKLLGAGVSALIGVFTSAGSALPGFGTVIGFAVGYFFTYWIINSLNAYTKQRELDYYIHSQTFHNIHFESSQTLSEKWWQDEYFGNIMPNTLQGSKSGVYTPVKVETDKYSYEGQIILAPSGIEKTSNFGTGFNHILLDFSQQTRNYLLYSDFDDPRLISFFTETINVFGVELSEIKMPSTLYMRNTIMYLENEIHSTTTSNEDKHYDRIIPYMVSIEPTLQFADSEGNVPLPEFYEDYPIFVSQDKFKSLKYEYHKIFKIFDGASQEVQLIPEENIHMFESDIVSFYVYMADVYGNEEFIGNYSNCFIFNKKTGVLTLDVEIFQIFCNKLSELREKYGSDAYFVFEFNIEKYRSINDTRNLSVDKVHEIATMQTVQAGILEYLYQFTIAKKTQERLSEIAYTSFITIVSTFLTLGISYGFKGFTGSIKGGLGINLFRVSTAVFSETMEELYIDPWIEAYVSNEVRKAGGDAWEQILWSSFWESTRESGVSQVTQILGQGLNLINTQAQNQISQTLQLTPQESILNLQEMKEDFRMQKDKQNSRGEIVETVVSSILLFAGALSGGFFGTTTASILGNVMIIIGTEVSLVKEIIELTLTAKSNDQTTLGIFTNSINNRISHKVCSLTSFSPEFNKFYELFRRKLVLVRDTDRLTSKIKSESVNLKSSYMERSIINAAMEYFNRIKRSYRYSSDIRYLDFEKSIAVEKIINLKRAHEKLIQSKKAHYVIYRISLKTPGIFKTDMMFGDPYERLFKFFERPFTSKLRIGQARNHWEGRTYTIKERIDKYFAKAFALDPYKRDKNSFSMDLRALVGMKEYESNIDIIKKAKSDARNLIKVDILHICNSWQEVDAAERFWIYFYKARFPEYGYNIERGGQRRVRQLTEGIFLMRLYNLKWADIDRVLTESLEQSFVYGSGGAKEYVANSLGLANIELDALIQTLFKSESRTKTILGEGIEEFDYIFNSYFDHRPLTFSEIRELYIGRRIILLMKMGFWEQWEVARQFGIKTHEEGSGVNTLNRWCYRIFGKSFNQLKIELLDSVFSPLVRKFNLKGELSYADIAEFIPGMDEAQVRYWMDIIYGHKVPSSTSFRSGFRYTSGLENLRKLVKRDLAIPLFMLDVDGDTILKMLGYIPGSEGRFKDKQEYFKKMFDWGDNNRLDEITARLIFTGRYLPPNAWNQHNIKYRPWWEHLENFLDDFY